MGKALLLIFFSLGLVPNSCIEDHACLFNNSLLSCLSAPVLHGRLRLPQQAIARVLTSISVLPHAGALHPNSCVIVS